MGGKRGKRLTPLWSCGLRSMAQAPVQRRRIGRTEIWRCQNHRGSQLGMALKSPKQEPRNQKSPRLQVWVFYNEILNLDD